MRVLVTGAAGYVGSMLMNFLLDAGHEVLAYDSLVFGGEPLQHYFINENFEFQRGDIRDTKKLGKLLDEWKPEAIVHLAAIVGAPECDDNVELAEEVNYNATCRLIDLAAEKGVGRFIFTSTCSNYGVADTSKLATEEDEVNPVSSYADTKVRAEQYVIGKKGEGNLSPVVLRLATAFGISPRMRFDLLVNNFVRDAWADKKLVIFAGNAWRPNVHVSDISRAIVTVLEKDNSELSGEIINVGRNEFNLRKTDLADLIKEGMGGELDVTIASETKDPRNYRVAFDKMEKLLGIQAERTPKKGVEEVLNAVQNDIFADLHDPRYKNRHVNINILGDTF